MFGFRIVIKDQPLTRRGILSTISSVYDPLGIAAPFLLVGKKILQDLCRTKLGWDDEIWKSSAYVRKGGEASCLHLSASLWNDV